ncbi:MAG: hypothetical protein ACREIT_09140 [Tepidisphaeraceae bacterium]
MKTIWRLIIFALLVGGWAVVALSLHVVWTGQNVIVVPKSRLGVRDTYVDVRQWTQSDATAHPDLMQRLEESGKADLVRQQLKPATEPTTQPRE